MQEEPIRLAVIVGSTRDGRFATTVATWFSGEVGLHLKAEVDVIDLAEVPLPVVMQAAPVNTGVYESAEVRALAARIEAADAFVVITAEYNHSFPASLKLAVDSVHLEWRGKPVAFVSYGGLSGGLRAVEHLRQVFAELRAVTVRNTVSFHMMFEQFDEHGRPRQAAQVSTATATMLAELEWWARALRRARRDSPFMW
ncbi:NADPH-dependent FMN reductase [Actinomadura rugatobispora]|uniref:NADPH-dependent FMN reductase n=1 Tax=Actinomadura rugatobispora TaxID=1994 RepID=A0ABW0ZRS4_9ACTN|nr:NAD(P)H-dependent oxidoreductase [Actinomadura rugatobispora]